jgi:hypothetical protein
MSFSIFVPFILPFLACAGQIPLKRGDYEPCVQSHEVCHNVFTKVPDSDIRFLSERTRYATFNFGKRSNTPLVQRPRRWVPTPTAKLLEYVQRHDFNSHTSKLLGDRDDHQIDSESQKDGGTEGEYIPPRQVLGLSPKRHRIEIHRSRWVCRQVRFGNHSTSRRPSHVREHTFSTPGSLGEDHACSVHRILQTSSDDLPIFGRGIGCYIQHEINPRRHLLCASASAAYLSSKP